MGVHPLNLMLRLFLELYALFAMGNWGWNQSEGISRYLLAVTVPLIAAVLWGTFAVLEDPSRSGKAPVPVSGVVRLVLEIVFFAFAAWALFALGAEQAAWVFGGLSLFHYAISYDRILWLIKQKG